MAENKPEEGEKKSSKKLFLIIALLLLAVGGGAGYYFFMREPAPAEQTEKPSAKKPKEVEGEQIAGEEAYYDLLSPLIVNFPADSNVRIVKVSVTVLVKDEASAEILKKHEPMIRNNLLMVISSLGAAEMQILEGKQRLREMMLTEIGKVMEKMAGKNTAKDVFFTEFVMQ